MSVIIQPGAGVLTSVAGAGGGPDVPDAILADWWDFQDISLSINDPVDSWVGGLGVHTWTASGTARPTLQADGVLLDGIDDIMSIPSSSDFDPVGGLWVGLRMRTSEGHSNGTTGPIGRWADSGSNNFTNWGVSWGSGNDVLVLYMRNNAFQSIAATSAPLGIDDDNFHYLYCASDDVNNLAIIGQDIGPEGSSSITSYRNEQNTLWLGKYYVGGNPMLMTVSRIVICKTYPSSAQITALKDWLS